ncbi:hypothetical protein COEREDRAFT_86619 [Coemansia reversa NRRL 1564]|uniref:Uncharacterized protein n=1 Tax=Coemansia reversa (strain ATCC 12441 / NRRL 1564) TaxID=763665 RepID=A0A2G5BCV6_COERN|nr:hypothetical protein COEREDRAFT_86619 [Coemansia reversa NRRL 1564]|eukprot:PIA16854.1 hypothetical protein COEREDRAFT_86619 [Coemansia reversa NRRL 1564]
MAFRATASLRQSLKLRPAFELALRSSCLQLVLARWGLETAALMGLQGNQTANDDDRKLRAVEAITDAMYKSGLDDHATSAEKEMLEKPYRSWEYSDYVYGDNWEALGALQWLLGRQHVIPPYYSSFDRARLFRNTAIMPADPSTIENFVDTFMSSQIRQHVDAQQLQHAVNTSEAWIWRARAQVLLGLREEISNDTADRPGSQQETALEAALRTRHIPSSLRKIAADLPNTIPLAAKHSLDKGLIGSVESDDFGIVVEMKETPEEVSANQPRTTTVPYRNLDSDHLDALRKIAESRFMAFAWALGKIDTWDIEKTGELLSINPINAIWTPENE